MPGSGQALNAVMAKYDQLKKAWESKKLDDAGKMLLDLKIELTMLGDGDKDERVSVTDFLILKCITFISDKNFDF